jgi:hypothetical protein
LAFASILYLYGRIQTMTKTTGWFLFFLLVGASCLDEPECFRLNNNVAGISFRKMSDSASDTVVFDSIWADATDSIFFRNVMANGVDLPLNFYDDTTTYYFKGLNQLDTLIVAYTARTQLVSRECGERFVLGDMHVVHSTFDSIRILNRTPKPNLTSGTNLQIFRCPNRNQVKLRFDQPVEITSVEVDYPVGIVLPSEPVSTFTVPLNPDATTTTIQFTIEGRVTDSITLNYKITRETLFSPCNNADQLGTVVLSDFTVVSKTFSDAVVIDSVTQDPPLTNIEITL